MAADAPNTAWAMDFQLDATTDGRPVKIISIVDEYTHECLGCLDERSITADTVIDELHRLAADRSYSLARCVNGADLACVAMADWASHASAWRVHPARQAVARRVHRIVQRPGPRRMPDIHQF